MQLVEKNPTKDNLIGNITFTSSNRVQMFRKDIYFILVLTLHELDLVVHIEGK
jgi:hypothetical protein